MQSQSKLASGFRTLGSYSAHTLDPFCGPAQLHQQYRIFKLSITKSLENKLLFDRSPVLIPSLSDVNICHRPLRNLWRQAEMQKSSICLERKAICFSTTRHEQTMYFPKRESAKRGEVRDSLSQETVVHVPFQTKPHQSFPVNHQVGFVSNLTKHH